MVVTASPARLLSLSRAADGGEGYRDRGSPGGCRNQDDNGRWNGCRDKIRFCCLSAEGAGKPTSPYPTLISPVPVVPNAHRQHWYETTPGASPTRNASAPAWNLTGMASYARMMPHPLSNPDLRRAYFLCSETARR